MHLRLAPGLARDPFVERMITLDFNAAWA